MAGTRRGSRLVYDGEDVQVRRDTQRASGRLVTVDGMEASYVDLADPCHLEFSYLRRFRELVQLTFPASRPLQTVHLGAGGVTFPRFLLATRRDVRCEVYDPSAEVIAVARRHLGVHDSAALRVVEGDGRDLMERLPDGGVDLLVEDAFVDGLPPRRLSSVGYFLAAARVLKADGMHLVNVVDVGAMRLSRAVAAGMLTAHDGVVAVLPRKLLRGRGVGNVVLAAGFDLTALDRLARRCARDEEPAEVWPPDEVAAFAAGTRPYDDPP